MNKHECEARYRDRYIEWLKFIDSFEADIFTRERIMDDSPFSPLGHYMPEEGDIYAPLYYLDEVQEEDWCDFASTKEREDALKRKKKGKLHMTDTNFLLFELFEKYPENFFCIETEPEFEKNFEVEHLEVAFYPEMHQKNGQCSERLYREIMLIDDMVETVCESWSTSHERFTLPEKLPPNAWITLRFCYTWDLEAAAYIPKRVLEIKWHTQI